MNMKIPIIALAVTPLFVSCKPDPTPSGGPDSIPPPAEQPVDPPTEPETDPDPETPTPEAALNPSLPDSYLGLEQKVAGDTADQAGVKWRVIEIDGQPLPATMDYRPDRLNFAIKDGKVIRVTQG